MAERIHYLVHGGAVQGVGFRYFTEKRAVQYGISGWVRNTDTNKVEGEAQGTPEAIAKFKKAIDDGPRYAHVVKLDIEALDVVEGEAGFEIRRK